MAKNKHRPRNSWKKENEHKVIITPHPEDNEIRISSAHPENLEFMNLQLKALVNNMGNRNPFILTEDDIRNSKNGVIDFRN